MMIADVMLSNESHAIGKIIAAAIAPAHQLRRLFRISVMTSKLVVRRAGDIRRATDIARGGLGSLQSGA
jgi:hypothetical protein